MDHRPQQLRCSHPSWEPSRFFAEAVVTVLTSMKQTLVVERSKASIAGSADSS